MPLAGLAKVKRAYDFLAYLTFNCIVLIVVANLILGAIFFVRGVWIDARVSNYREKFADYEAYARTPKVDVTAFLDEQDSIGSIGFQYEPWVQFRHPAFRGRLLNTDEHGFRATRAPAIRSGRPLIVHVFGGSTTFGYGVPDDHTIPSYLQKLLEERQPNQRVLIKNYGQGYYYSSQAQLVFLSLIKSGEVPSWAIFIDGGNDTSQLALRHDEPVFTPAMKRLWAARVGGSSASLHSSLAWLPMVRLASGVVERLALDQSTFRMANSERHLPIKSDTNLSEAEKVAIVEYVIRQYHLNMRIRRALCREFGVKCLFVWQPHPAYKYNRSLHKSFPFEGDVPDYFKRVYARMESVEDSDFLNLADLTQDPTEKVYVDEVHYNELLNERIAGRIANAMHQE